MTRTNGRITVELDVTPLWWNGEEHRVAVGVAAAMCEAGKAGAVREVRAAKEGLRLVVELPAEDSPVAAVLERLRGRVLARLAEFRWADHRVTAVAAAG